MNYRIKVIVPFPMDERGVANRRAQIPNEMIRPGFQVDFVPVKNSCALCDSYYDVLIFEMFIFEAGLDAEREGYDAVCIDSVSDSARSLTRLSAGLVVRLAAARDGDKKAAVAAACPTEHRN